MKFDEELEEVEDSSRYSEMMVFCRGVGPPLERRNEMPPGVSLPLDDWNNAEKAKPCE